MILFCENISAQTEKQTIEWIKQTFSELNIETRDGSMKYLADVFFDTIPRSDTRNENVLSITVVLNTTKDSSLLFVMIPLKRSTVYMSNTDEFIVMNFIPKTGTIKGVYFVNSDVFEHEFTKQNICNLKFVDNEFNRIRITKLIKAIRHLIRLYGGTAPDENLF